MPRHWFEREEPEVGRRGWVRTFRGGPLEGDVGGRRLPGAAPQQV
jgi:hypothetical protein